MELLDNILPKFGNFIGQIWSIIKQKAGTGTAFVSKFSTCLTKGVAKSNMTLALALFTFLHFKHKVN